MWQSIHHYAKAGSYVGDSYIEEASSELKGWQTEWGEIEAAEALDDRIQLALQQPARIYQFKRAR